MFKLTVILGIFFLAVIHHGTSSPFKRNKLIYIMLDGFRYDYVDLQPKGNLPGFNKFLDNGVRAEYMTPIFPSISYPDWTTLVTGLFVESHGIVGNNFYDAEDKSGFILLDSNSTARTKWWTSEPIWATASKANVKTAVSYWSRCDIPFDAVTPDFCEYFVEKNRPPFRESIQKVVSKLQEGYDFIMVYNSLADNVGHPKGPESEEMKEAVRELDSGIVDLLRSLEDMNMKDEVNTIIVSDHGMVQMNQESVNKVDLDQYLLLDYVENIAGTVAYSNIKVKEGHVDEVYNKLKKMPGVEVYKHNEIPEELHFKNNKYIHDIVIKADINTRIMKSTSKVQLSPRTNENLNNGEHGFDPREEKMRAIFFANGPDFKKNSKIPAIKNVDVYPLLTHLLRLRPNPNNGTFENIKMALAVPEQNYDSTPDGSTASSGAAEIIGTLLPLILAMVFRNVY